MSATKTLTESIAESVGYDPENEGDVEDLIAYKNALEDALGSAEERLTAALEAASRRREDDERYWTELATGQDSEEAEESGALCGREDAYREALAIVRGESVAAIPVPFETVRGKVADAASWARTALDDPASIPDEDLAPFVEQFEPRSHQSALTLYAIAQLDTIINATRDPEGD